MSNSFKHHYTNKFLPKIQELKPKIGTMSGKINNYIKDSALPRLSVLFEDYGKTILMVVIVFVVLFLFLSSFLKIEDRNATQKIGQSGQASLNTNPSLDNDLAFAGFTANYKDSGFLARIQTSDKLTDKIQIFNDRVIIDVQSQTFALPSENRGLNPAQPEVVAEKNVDEFISFKDRKFGLSSPFADNDKRINTYKLLDLSSMEKRGEEQVLAYQYPILAPANVPEGQSTKTEISITIKTEGLSGEQLQQALDSTKPVLASLDRVDKREIFINSTSKFDLDRLFKENQGKFVQSDLLKYRIYIPDGYSLKSDDKIDKVYISNEKSSLEILKRANQAENLNAKMSNIIQVGTAKAYRPASITEIEENVFKMQLYGNEGKSTTVNVSRDSSNKNHNLLIKYKFNLSQTSDELRKTVSDFDAIVSSITENKAPSGSCEFLRGQTIPFKSPLCGGDLDWTQINKPYSQEHKAVDLVPNQRYVKDNPHYLRDKQEYFYATCDGKLRTYQDRDTGANVIDIQCKEPDFKVQYWHDQQSYWNWSGDVKSGDIIGIVGETGNSKDGRHIHYIIEKAGVRQDPLQLIKNN